MGSTILQILAAAGVFLLLWPTLRYLFRQEYALRNALIWTGLMVAVGYGFLHFGHLLPENVKQNFGISSQPILPPAPDEAPPAETPPAPDTEDQGPVRNL